VGTLTLESEQWVTIRITDDVWKYSERRSNRLWLSDSDGMIFIDFPTGEDHSSGEDSLTSAMPVADTGSGKAGNILQRKSLAGKWWWHFNAAMQFSGKWKTCVERFKGFYVVYENRS
jgi:hypothetical protein